MVIHPLAGYREALAFATDPGRLCVALSRHRAHATIVLDMDTETVLRQAQADAPHDLVLMTQRRIISGLNRSAIGFRSCGSPRVLLVRAN